MNGMAKFCPHLFWYVHTAVYMSWNTWASRATLVTSEFSSASASRRVLTDRGDFKAVNWARKTSFGEKNIGGDKINKKNKKIGRW